ncbi:hypothetical protein [Escherichia coli]|nr:hypothetical protein [Escherichia coli]
MKEFSQNQTKIIAALKKMYDNGYEPPIVVPNDQNAAFALPDLKDMFFSTKNEVTKNLFNLLHAS